MTAIKFVREYQMYGRTYYDIVYKTHRLTTRTPDDLPETARRFMVNAKTVTEQYDPVFKWDETIYQ